MSLHLKDLTLQAMQEELSKQLSKAFDEVGRIKNIKYFSKPVMVLSVSSLEDVPYYCQQKTQPVSGEGVITGDVIKLSNKTVCSFKRKCHSVLTA